MFETLRQFLQRPVGKLIAILCVIAVVGLFFRLLTPTAPRVLKSVPAPVFVTSKPSGDFSGATVVNNASQPQIDPELPVVRVTPISLMLTNLASQLQLPRQVSSQVWQSVDGNQTLSLDLTSQRLSYSDESFSGDFDAALVQKLNTDQALSTAKNFVTQVLGTPSLKPEENSVSYGRKDDPEVSYKETSVNMTPKGSNLITIPFEYRINDLPVFSETNLTPMVIVTVDSTNKVIRAVFSNHLFVVQDQLKAKTQTLEAALKSVSENKSVVISMTSAGVDGFVLKQIQNLEIKSAKIEYRYFENIQSIIPMYRIQGTLTQQGTQTTTDVDMLVPAVVVAAKQQ